MAPVKKVVSKATTPVKKVAPAPAVKKNVPAAKPAVKKVAPAPAVKKNVPAAVSKKAEKPVTKKSKVSISDAEADDLWAKSDANAEYSNIENLKLEQGDNFIKLVSEEIRENYCVFVKDTEGKDRKINMTDSYDESMSKYGVVFENCPELNNKPQHKYYVKALVGKRQEGVNKQTGKKTVKYVFDPKAKVFMFGKTIRDDISGIRASGEYGKLTDIVLKINKTGDKLNTKYQVLPSTFPANIDKDEEIVDEISLSELIAPTDLAVVHEILGLEYDGEENETVDDDGGDEEQSEEYTEGEDDGGDVTDDDEVTDDEVTDDEGADDEGAEDAEEEQPNGFSDWSRKEIIAYIEESGLDINPKKYPELEDLKTAAWDKYLELQQAESDAEEPDPDADEILGEDGEEDEISEEIDSLEGLDDLGDDDVEDEEPAPKKKPLKKGK
jgi:hypothetical protein